MMQQHITLLELVEDRLGARKRSGNRSGTARVLETRARSNLLGSLVDDRPKSVQTQRSRRREDLPRDELEALHRAPEHLFGDVPRILQADGTPALTRTQS